MEGNEAERTARLTGYAESEFSRMLIKKTFEESALA
jgi:hypothetical protein